jgi:hypothetical protein
LFKSILFVFFCEIVICMIELVNELKGKDNELRIKSVYVNTSSKAR